MNIKDFAYKVDDFVRDYYMEKGFLARVYLGVGSLGDIRKDTAEFRIEDKRITDVELLKLLTNEFPKGKFWIQYNNNIFFEYNFNNEKVLK